MSSCRSGLPRVMVGVVLTAASTVAVAGNATIPGGVTTPYPTVINLSVVWEIQGDDDLDGVVTVRYRASGEEKWREGLPLRRVPAGVTRSPAVPGYTWSNKHAGSIFDLRPDTQYEIALKLHDPDGSDAERTVRAKTRPVPRVPPNAPVRTCTPATFSAVLGAANAGDIVLCGPGSYGNVTVPRDGAEGKPLVLRAGPGATFSRIVLRNRKHVYVEGATVTGNGCIDLIGAESCVVRRCTVNLTGSSYGIGADRPPGARNCYISDNVVIGPETWSIANMYPDCVGEGIEMTGPGNVICYNSVRGCRDCISTMEGRHASRQISIDIYNNDISAGCDDAIEADYCMNNCRIMRNRITNCFVALSAQPTMGGPTYFIRNVMYNLSSTSLKFHCYTMGDVVLHNTAVKSGGGMICYAGEAFDYAYFRNNLCIGGPVDPALVAKHSWATWGSGSPAWIGAAGPHCSFDYDALGTVANIFQGQIGTQQVYTSFAELLKGPQETHAIQVDMRVFKRVAFPYPSVPELPHPDLRPVSGSAVVDNALLLPNVNDGFLGAGPDRGAYEAGQDFPHYGPRPEGMDERQPQKAKPERKRPERPARRQPTEAEIAEQEAEQLFKVARRAERMRQREAATSFYRKIVDEFPDTDAAERAAERLEKLAR